MLVVLGTGWAIEKTASNAPRQSEDVTSEPAKANDADATPFLGEPVDVQPAATDSRQENDRSDLILIHG